MTTMGDMANSKAFFDFESSSNGAPSVVSTATTAVHGNLTTTITRQTPSFFASTKPEPTSPPKLPRRRMPLTQESKDDVVKTSPVMAVNEDVARESPPPAPSLEEDEDDADPSWQEKATAFAHEVMAKSRQVQTDADSLSTASEMGTVVDAARIDEVDGMMSSPSTPKVANRALDDDVDDLALPILDGRFSEKVPMPSSPRAAGILTAAMRRMGSGVGRTSAPSTPRATPLSPPYRAPHSAPRYFDPSREDATPPSFLLRSPGSSARIAAKRSSKVLSPRFGSLRRTMNDASTSVSTRGTIGGDLAVSTTNALHIARACFSFDAYDTSMDEQYEFTVPTTDLRPSHLGATVEETIPESPGFRGSASWDVGGQQESAFRLRSSNVRNRSVDETHKQFEPRSPRPLPGRERSLSDWSPQKDDCFVELKSPLRIEIEREDALDILACLVERGMSMKDNHYENSSLKPTEAVDQSKHDLAAAVAQLKTLIGQGVEDGIDVQQLAAALDELLRSHEYATEMRQVSKSASSWLKSIGRPSSSAKVNSAPNNESLADVDLLTAKAMLHSARIELEEKTMATDRLNAELAKCRAEIGRLRTSASTSFRSPNRSILDESEDISVGEEIETSIDRSFDNASPIPGDHNTSLDSSFEDIIPLRQDKSDLVKFQKALEEANEVIRKLHGDLKAQATGDVLEDAPVVQVSAPAAEVEDVESPDRYAPPTTVNVRMLDGENYITEWDELRPSLPPPPDHGIRSPIVTALLDQWTTDKSLQESLLSWMEAVLNGADAATIPPLTLSSLDHSTRDGFVMHVLPLLLRRHDIRVDVQTRAQRMTSYDLAIYIDKVMGLSAHGPPQLLRRHLETTASRSDYSGVDSTTHSATTALINNTLSTRGFLSNDEDHGPMSQPFPSGLSHDEMADGVATHQPSIMSALGGALGGLLARRTPREGHDGTMPVISESSPMRPKMMRGSFGMPDDHFVEKKHDDGDASMQPYHRVVAAPPGRLCITFVEYRGHAMVSDVAENSPLVGWIFPSDILIAIDELPVSGMRVRDIIKVLKDRKERQRALRVISSHDMTELTLNASTTMPEGPS